MKIRCIPFLFLALCLAMPAHAHFLWAHIKQGESPALQVRFTEEPDEITSPQLLAKLKPGFFTYATEKPQAGKLPVNSDTAVLPKAFRIVSAHQTWGVMDRTAQDRGVFLLEYHAKAAQTEVNAALPTRTGLELVAKRTGRKLIVQAYQDGWPAPKASVLLYFGTARDAKVTDDTGNVTFDLPAENATMIALRADSSENKSGTFDKKSYKLVRHYATLTFPLASGLNSDAPTKADSAAWNLLKAAHDNRRTMGDDFPGMSAEIVVDDNGAVVRGKMAYDKSDGVKLTLAGASTEAKAWAEGQIMNLLGHRRGGDFAKGDGKNPITFAPDDKSPFGRRVLLHDTLKSEYRVKGNVVTEVTRTMGDDRFTITVLETTDAGGKYLPRHFLVTYFDAVKGDLKHVDAYTDTHANIEGRWVPTMRRVVSGEKGALTVRSLALENIRFVKP